MIGPFLRKLAYKVKKRDRKIKIYFLDFNETEVEPSSEWALFSNKRIMQIEATVQKLFIDAHTHKKKNRYIISFVRSQLNLMMGKKYFTAKVQKVNKYVYFFHDWFEWNLSKL